MARSRSGSNLALISFLIVSILAFLVALILAIMFNAQSNRALADARAAQTELTQVISAADRTRVTSLIPADSTGPTLMSRVLDELQSAKILAVSSPELSATQIRNQLAQFGLSEDENFESYMARMRAEERSDKDVIDDLEAQLADARAQLQAEVRNRESLFQRVSTDLTSVGRTLEQERNAFGAYRQELDAQVANLREQLENARTQQREQAADNAAVAEGLERTIRDLQERLTLATGPTEQGRPDIRPELEPDGSIVSVLERENMVYINLGRRDRVLPGLTFEVFDALRGVTTDEYGDVRGKATIEVVRTTSDTASLGRIVRRRANASVVEGDLIANVVYDRNMVFKFTVVGDFDIENTGIPTRSDRRRIEAMIEQWGGELAPALSYATDFLVLGPPPDLPEPLAPDEINPERIREHQAAVSLFNRYQVAIGEAERLRIPILNQNRFLVLVGYYRR